MLACSRRPTVAFLFLAATLAAYSGEERRPARVGERLGDPERGAQVFVNSGCAVCHTFTTAGSRTNLGPNLGESLPARTPADIQAATLDPNVEIAEGWEPEQMPQNYRERLSDEELADLVAFLAQAL